VLKGASPFYWTIGIVTVIAGGSVLSASIWAFHKPRLGIELAALAVVLMLLEGAFRLRRASREDALTATQALQERLRPRLRVAVPPPHFTPFDPPESGSGKYATIDIEATEAVTGCCGHITAITTEGIEVPVRAPIPLRWIAHNSLRRDLVPGIGYGMTVVFAESGRPNEFLISTDTHEPRGIPWALRQGISVIKVVVSADNVPPLPIELRVNASNDWRLLDMKSAEAWANETRAEWAEAHPISAELGLIAGGTGPYDEVREAKLREERESRELRELQERAARRGTGPGTISFPPYSEEPRSGD
jgi:hypothetical protein